MGVRDRFVKDTLEAEGRKMLRYQGTRIASVVQEHTGRLRAGRSMAVTGGDEMDGKLSFTHVIYERFLDMKRLGNRKSRKRKIHNRFTFGMYSSIVRRLMYGLTDDVAREIKDSMNP